MEGQSFCGRAIAKLATRSLEERPPLPVSEQDEPALTRLHNGLLVSYVVDQGDRFQYVQRRHLTAEGLSETDLHRVGVANLEMRLAHNGAEVHPCADVFLLVFDGHFDASLILVDSVWDEDLADFAPSGFVVGFPKKNILAFSDANFDVGPLQIQRIIEHVGGGDHPTATSLYYRDPVLRDWRSFRETGLRPN
jgi:uncharacterized protein YtpQ (UPF0354 family)